MPRAGYDSAMRYAITRQVSAAITGCELTLLERVPIDISRARAQHAMYERALAACGVTVRHADALDTMPDAVFVEDTAVVLPEGAILLRPGAESRRGEVPSIEKILAQYCPLERLSAPATMDGGDVLVVGKRIFVGRSSRTNEAGFEQLRAIVERWDYTVIAVDVSGCLHLKSAVTCVGDKKILVNPAWVNPALFDASEIIAVDPAEPYAANGLLVGTRLIFPDHFSRTRERLLKRGIDVLTVLCDELAKAEGAVTCCSILFDV